MICKQKGQHHQRNRQPNDLIPSPQDHGEVAYQPGRERLRHFILVRQIICNAADHIAEHDAHQRNHHHVLKLDALNEPDEYPGAKDRKYERKNGSPP